MESASQLSEQKVLVTGASGFIGNHLCRRLLQLGSEVHGISRKALNSNSGSARWWQGDVADIKTVREVLTMVKPDLIYHLAGHVSGSRDLQLVMPTFHSNLHSTANLLTVVTEIGCRRVILAGSLEESEEDHNAAVPCSPYAASKLASSLYGRMFDVLYQTPVVTARIFMAYGPEQQDLTKLIPYVILTLLRSRAPKLSSGSRPVDWIYIDDLVDGLVALASASSIEGDTVDLGSGHLITSREIVNELVRQIDPNIEPLFGALSDRPMEQVRMANIAESYTKIKWKPGVPIRTGLEKTIKWYERLLETQEIEI